MEIRYSYRDAPTLKAFSQSNAFLRGLMGPFRSGKSSACVVEIVKRAQAQKPGPDGKRHTRWIVVRNTFRQLEDTTIKTFFQWLPPIHFGDYRQTKHDYHIHGFEGCDIEVMFRALDRPDHVKNLLSLEVTGGWVNEAREVPWAVIEALQGRVGQFPTMANGGPTWHGLFMDTNPPDTDSKWYKFFEEGDAPAHFAQIFKQPSGLSDRAENVAHLVGGRGYYDNLAIGKDAEWIKVYIKGEYGFVVDGKPVYPEYSDEFHCAKPDKNGEFPDCTTRADLPVYRGWDWGLTPAAVFCQPLPGGRLMVVDELCATYMGADRFSDEVLAHSSQNYPGREFIDIGDPAGDDPAQSDESTCFAIVRAKNIAIEPGLQSQQIRKESLRRPLRQVDRGRPMFQIHPRCTKVRKGLMGGYHFRRLQVSGSDRFRDVPEKNEYSHPVEALEYVCTRLFGEGLTTPRDDGRRGRDDDDAVVLRPGRSPITGY